MLPVFLRDNMSVSCCRRHSTLTGPRDDSGKLPEVLALGQTVHKPVSNEEARLHGAGKEAGHTHQGPGTHCLELQTKVRQVSTFVSPCGQGGFISTWLAV